MLKIFFHIKHISNVSPPPQPTHPAPMPIEIAGGTKITKKQNTEPIISNSINTEIKTVNNNNPQFSNRFKLLTFLNRINVFYPLSYWIGIVGYYFHIYNRYWDLKKIFFLIFLNKKYNFY